MTYPQNTPRMPEWLIDDIARAMWDEITPILVTSSRWQDSYTLGIGHLCNLHSALGRMFAAGNYFPEPIAEFRLLLAEFGLTPASRQ